MGIVPLAFVLLWDTLPCVLRAWIRLLAFSTLLAQDACPLGVVPKDMAVPDLFYVYHHRPLQAKRAELSSELAVLRSRREQLSGLMASTPQPAASRKVLKRLQQASEQLQLLQSLQVRWGRVGWSMCCAAAEFASGVLLAKMRQWTSLRCYRRGGAQCREPGVLSCWCVLVWFARVCLCQPGLMPQTQQQLTAPNSK
jgi:hypothetical protein